MLAAGDEVRPGQLPPQQEAAISLPALLFQMIADRTNVGVFFALYDTPILFPVDGGSNINSDTPRKTEVGSRVLAATVGPGLDFPILDDPVIVVLRLQITDTRVRQYSETKPVLFSYK